MPDSAVPEPQDTGEDSVDLAIQYALDAVTDSERADIEDWIRTTDSESARVFDMTVHDVRETMAALAVLDAQEPPARLEARVLAAIERQREANTEVRHTDSPDSPAPSGAGAAVTPLPRGTDLEETPDESRTPGAHAGDETPSRPGRAWRRLAAAAAAVVVAIGIGIAVAGIEQRSGDDTRGEVTAQEIRDRADTRSLSTEVGSGTLTVQVSAELGAATVSFSEVPAPPPGSDYQLWLIDAAGDPRSAGVLAELPADADPYVTEVTGPGQLAVTLEPDGGSPAPTSNPLGAVALG